VKKIIFFCILLQVHKTNAQAVWDTTKELSRHEAGYARFSPSVKLTAAYNGFFTVELAHVRNNLSLVWLMSNTATKYYALQWNANTNYKAGLWGAKFGGEMDFRFLHLGVGMLTQTDFKSVHFYVTPTLGLSWWGTVGVYYGFVWLIGKRDFIGNNSYQIGLKYNFTKNLFKEVKNGMNF
jgi:hypothetical protein